MGLFGRSSASKAKSRAAAELKEQRAQARKEYAKARAELVRIRGRIFDQEIEIDRQTSMNTRHLDRNWLILNRQTNKNFQGLNDAIRLNNLRADLMMADAPSKAQGRELRFWRKAMFTREIDKAFSDMVFNLETERIKINDAQENLNAQYNEARKRVADAYHQVDMKEEELKRDEAEMERAVERQLDEIWDTSTGNIVTRMFSNPVFNIAIGAITGGLGTAFGGGFTGALMGAISSFAIPAIGRAIGLSPQFADLLGSIGINGLSGMLDFGKALGKNIGAGLEVLTSVGGKNMASAYTSFLNAPSLTSSFKNMMGSFGGNMMLGKINMSSKLTSALMQGMNGSNQQGSIFGTSFETLKPSSFKPNTGRAFDALQSLQQYVMKSNEVQSGRIVE